MNETIVRIILDILVIVLIILGILWKTVAARKNNPANPETVDLEMIPGHSTECQGRGEAITRLEEKFISVTSSIERIDKNIANMWKYMKKNGPT